MISANYRYGKDKKDYINNSDELKKQYIYDLMYLKKENEYIEKLIFKMHDKKNSTNNAIDLNVNASIDIKILNNQILNQINRLLDTIDKL